MRHTIRTVTPANDIPKVISLEAAKHHLRVDGNDDDALISALILSAQDHVERFTSQVLTPRDLEMVFDAFPCEPVPIFLPRTPVTEITSLKYSNPDSGAEIVADAGIYRWADTAADQLLPAFAGSWPRAAAERGSVRLQFKAGYEEGLAPSSLEAAVKLILGALYVHREGVITGTIVNELPTVVQLLTPYRQTGN